MSLRKRGPEVSLLLILAIVLGLFVQLPISGSTMGADSPGNHAIDLSPPDKADKGNPKLDSILQQLIDAEATGRGVEFSQQVDIDYVGSTVTVVVESQPGKTQSAIAAARAAGGDVEVSYGNQLQVRLPVSALDGIANNPNIDFVRLPRAPAADETIESLSLINASTWNSGGYNGSGIKIGILDIGFYNYSTLLGTDLPSSVTTWWAPSIGDEGTSVHGAACAEIIHDIAPNASLYLANVGWDTEWGPAIDWFISQDVDIISCSLSWMNDGPGDGTGNIDNGVTNASNAGIFWANSAGNYAKMHWMGAWNNSDGDDWMDFALGDESNAINVSQVGQRVTAGLRWDDTWGASANDYDLYLLNASQNIVASSTYTQNGSQNPVEYISYYANDTGVHHIAVYNFSADCTANFHINTFNHNLQYNTSAYSLLQPADSPNAVTTGAVWWNDLGTIESFSSQGPTTDNRTKPDIVAPDGVSTVSYGAGNFFGTSASAPHTAGMAALILERFSFYTPSQIQAYLENHAVELGAPGKDNVFGSGRADLQSVPVAPNTSIDAIPDYVDTLNYINGSATDTDGSITQVQLTINRSDTSFYWNGSGWQSGVIWINASPSDGAFDSASESWTINTSSSPPIPTWNAGVTYYIAAKAVDDNEEADPSPAAESFTFGNAPPDTAIDPILDYIEDIGAINGSATDTDGTIHQVEIQINRSDTSFYWNGSGWQSGTIWINTSPTDGAFASWSESWTINTSTVPPLPSWENDVTYFVKAKAIDDYSDPDPTPAEESFTIGEIGWKPMDTGIGDDLYGIWGSNTSDIFSVGGDSEFEANMIIHYNGSAWDLMNIGSHYILEDVWGSSASDVFAVGSRGSIIHYNGSAWDSMTSGTTKYLMGIWGNSSTDVFSVGIEGTILYYNGSAWTNMSSNTTDDLFGVWGSSSSDVFAVGYNSNESAPEYLMGTIMHYNGSEWSVSSEGTWLPLASVWGSGSSDVFATGAAGTILHYDGNTWSSMTSNTINPLFTVWGTSPTNVFAAGVLGTIMLYDGNVWVPSYSGTGNNLHSLWGTVRDVYVSGDKGTILHFNAYPDESVYITGPETATQGDNFSLTIGISKTTDLYTGQINLQYDPTIITVTNVSDGLLYGNASYTVPSAGNWSLNGSGPGNQGIVEITFNLSGYGGPIGIAEGSLAVVDFNANGLNMSDLHFLPTSSITDYYSTEIEASWYDDTVTVFENRPDPITDLACVSINHSTIRLTWTATGDGGGVYDIRYRPNASITEGNWDYSTTIKCTGEPTPQAAPASESFDVTGLDHNTQYYFAMKISNSGSMFSNMSNNTDCTTPPWYHDLSINVSPVNGGSTNGSGTYLHDTVVDITATPNGSCWYFTSWTGDTGAVADVNVSDTTITMLGNYSVTANFAIYTYNLNTSSTAGGSVTAPGEPGPYPYNCSDIVPIVATPDVCYHFVNWTGDTASIVNTSTDSTTITMNGDYDIQANFAIDVFDLTTSSTASGSVTAPGEPGPYPYNCSDIVPIIATADSCYSFVNWTGTGVTAGKVANASAASTTITMLGNYSVTANFAIYTYNLNTSSTAGGSVTAPGEPGPYPYNCSDIVPIVATPDACYHFVNWTGDTGSIVNTSAASTTITMNGDYDIQANFAFAGPFYLNISSSEYGNVSTPGEGLHGPYNCSDVVNLIAETDLGYEFVIWNGDTGTIADTGSPVTTITITDNYSITANFGLPPNGFYGDANRDGILSIMDYSNVQLMRFGQKAFNPGADANLDGLLSIMDYSTVQLMRFGQKPTIDKYEVPYDFLFGAGSNKWAKGNAISALPPTLTDNFDTDPGGWINASPTDYGNISLTDGSVWTIAGSPGNYSAIQCKFTIVGNASDFTSIGVTLNGSAETNGSTLQLWAWNFNAGSWRQIGGDLSMTTDIATYNAWTAWGKIFADYIDGDGYMYVLASLNTPDQDMNIDYIRLTTARP
ncbi:MAG: S8 family serine peptidase [Chloroflexota bacterium]|nr:S8 family serine peptidase [Chloroflexota bacterium]